MQVHSASLCRLCCLIAAGAQHDAGEGRLWRVGVHTGGILSWEHLSSTHTCWQIATWLAAPQPKDDKKKDGKKEGGAPDKAQRARTFLEAEFDDAVNALKQQVRKQVVRAFKHYTRLTAAKHLQRLAPGPHLLACVLFSSSMRAGVVKQQCRVAMLVDAHTHFASPPCRAPAQRLGMQSRASHRMPGFQPGRPLRASPPTRSCWRAWTRRPCTRRCRSTRLQVRGCVLFCPFILAPVTAVAGYHLLPDVYGAGLHQRLTCDTHCGTPQQRCCIPSGLYPIGSGLLVQSAAWCQTACQVVCESGSSAVCPDPAAAHHQENLPDTPCISCPTQPLPCTAVLGNLKAGLAQHLLWRKLCCALAPARNSGFQGFRLQCWAT